MLKGSPKLIGALVALAIIIVVNFINNKTNIPEQAKPRQEQRDKITENKRNNDPGRKNPTAPPSDEPNRIEGFNRNAGKLVFTKHARCRMGCRHIDEAEVRDILLNGRINERKSDPAARPDPKYALEGKTRDGQEVRIIFAPSDRGMVVITVIDLDTEWPCDCK